MGGLRERVTNCGSSNLLYGVFLAGFLWPIILLCLALSPYLVYLIWVPPPHARTSLSQDGFQHRGLWEGWHHLLWGGVPSLFGPRGAFLHIYSQEVSLTSRKRNMWSVYLLSGQGSSPPCCCYYLYLGISVHRRETWAAQPGAHLPPASRRLINKRKINRSLLTCA